MDVQPTRETSERPVRHLWLLGASQAILLFLFTLLALFTAQKNMSVLTKVTGLHSVHTSAVTLLFLALFGVYVLIFWFGPRMFSTTAGWRWTIIFAGILITILLLSPPFLSSDLYGYILRNIITIHHHINPYVVAPSDLGYSSIIIWPEQVMRYGPLFTLYSLGLGHLSGQSVAVGVLLFRLLNVAWFVLASWLIYRILGKTAPQYQRIGTALFLWNPFILMEVIHSSHNDILVLVALLASILCTVHKKYALAIITLTAGALVKFGIIFLAPIPLVMLLTEKTQWAYKIKQLLTAAVGSLGLTVLAYLPFGGWHDNILNLSQAYFGLEFLTVPKAIVLWIEHAFNAITNTQNATNARLAYLAAFIAAWLAIILIPRLMRKPVSCIKQYFWILLLLLMLLTAKMNVWYMVWIIPLPLLLPDKRYRVLALITTGFGLLYYNALGVFFASVILWLALAIYGGAIFIQYWMRKQTSVSR